MSLNLENFLFYIWVVVLWLNFTTQITWRDFTSHLLLMSMNKILDCKDHEIYSKMLRKICTYVKGKSNISFFVIKNPVFDQCFLMVKTFLKIHRWRFLAPHSEHLIVSSVTLSCMKQNILTLSMLVYYNTNSLFLGFSLMHLLLVCSNLLIAKVLIEIHFEFHCFKLLLSFITSKYSFFRRII